MSVKFTTVKCPECGASLQMEEGRNKMFCSYCGAQVILTNENEYVYRHIDEAGIKQAETDRMVELKKLEILEKKREEAAKIKVIKIIISIVLGAVAIIFITKGYGGNEPGYAMPGLICAMILLYMWLGSIGNRDNDIDIEDKIYIPSGANNFKNKNYQTVEAEFRSAGFSNIQCVSLQNLTTGLLKKPNMVESVSINGKDIKDFNNRAKVSPNAVVVISYHSFS